MPAQRVREPAARLEAIDLADAGFVAALDFEDVSESARPPPRVVFSRADQIVDLVAIPKNAPATAEVIIVEGQAALPESVDLAVRLT
jgi:hypothetical protein